MKILGVDPGLGITGYGVIESDKRGFTLLEAGIIKSTSRESLLDRLSRIYSNIGDIIREYKPTELILEDLYSHYKHHMTAIAMAHARGVIALTAAQTPRMKLINYPAKRVKKALTGNGNASKMQVQRTVQSVLGLKETPSPADISDALALAIAHTYMMRGIK